MADGHALPSAETQPDPLAALHEVRTPPLDGLSALADGALAVAAGLMAALLFSWLLDLATQRADSRRKQLSAALTASRAAPPAERLAAQARIHREAAPAAPLPPALAAALYKPGDPPDLDASEAIVRRLLRRRLWLGAWP